MQAMSRALRRLAQKAERHAAKAKPRPGLRIVEQRPHYDLLARLRAPGDAPMPPDLVRHNLTAIHLSLEAIERGDPKPEDARVMSDVVNLVDAMREMALADDPEGVLLAATASLARAFDRHLLEGAPLRLDGPGLQALRQIIATWEEALAALSHRQVLTIHAHVDKRIRAILAGREPARKDMKVVAI